MQLRVEILNIDYYAQFHFIRLFTLGLFLASAFTPLFSAAPPEFVWNEFEVTLEEQNGVAGIQVRAKMYLPYGEDVRKPDFYVQYLDSEKKTLLHCTGISALRREFKSHRSSLPKGQIESEVQLFMPLSYLPLAPGPQTLAIQAYVGLDNYLSEDCQAQFDEVWEKKVIELPTTSYPPTSLVYVQVGEWEVAAKTTTVRGKPRAWDRVFIFGDAIPEFRWALETNHLRGFVTGEYETYAYEDMRMALMPVDADNPNLTLHFFEEDDVKIDEVARIPLDIELAELPRSEQFKDIRHLKQCTVGISANTDFKYENPIDSLWVKRKKSREAETRLEINVQFNGNIEDYSYDKYLFLTARNKADSLSNNQPFSYVVSGLGYTTESGKELTASKKKCKLEVTLIGKDIDLNQIEIESFTLLRNEVLTMRIPGPVLSLKQPERLVTEGWIYIGAVLGVIAVILLSIGVSWLMKDKNAKAEDEV